MGSCRPALMSSTSSGTACKATVSMTAFQSASETSTAFPCLPVIVTGSWLALTSDSRLYSFALASVAVIVWAIPKPYGLTYGYARLHSWGKPNGGSFQLPKNVLLPTAPLLSLATGGGQGLGPVARPKGFEPLTF